MTSNTSDNLQSYIPVYDAIPENWDDSKQFLTESLKEISNAINQREIGFYLDEELLTGKSFIPGVTAPGNNPGIFRSILRKVIDFGAFGAPGIPLGLKEVPHGITFDSNFTLIQLWGAATDPTALVSINLGHAASAGNEVELYMNATNVVTVSASNRSSYTRVYIVIEYIQEL